MKAIVEHVWSSDFDTLIKRLKEEKPTHLIWLGVTEYNFPENWGKDLHILEQVLYENNIKMEFITGCDINDDYVYSRLVAPKVNMSIHPFPMYWVYETVRYLEIETTNVIPDIQPRTYINLNRNPHKFRCMMMDKLAERGLLSYGYNTWMRPGFYKDVWNFQHWEEKQLLLENEDRVPANATTDMNNDLTTVFSPPPEYFAAGINLAAESTSDIMFYTEKTMKNFFFKKPFIILGAQNINTNLKYYGFEIFEELVDYSFDNCSKLEDRIEGIADNIERLSKFPIYEIDQVLQKKLNHNYNRLMEIYYSKKFIPPVVEYYAKLGLGELDEKLQLSN